MPRIQVLAALVLLACPHAFATCRVHAVGQVRFEHGVPHLLIYAGSLSETRMKISPVPGTNHAELLFQLFGANGRTVVIEGTCVHAPLSRRGEVFTDLTRVRLTLPNALKANGGDELQVDPG